MPGLTTCSTTCSIADPGPPPAGKFMPRAHAYARLKKKVFDTPLRFC